MVEAIGAGRVILEQAMKMEQDGLQFYLNAAEATRDKKGREMFNSLADDEQKHYNLLKRQHAALTKEGSWAEFPEVKPVKVDLKQPLFPRGQEALGKAGISKSSDWDALLFGLDIETKSYDLYRKSALETSDPRGKQLFEFLAGQERSHFDVLMMRYDALFGPVSWRY